MQIWRNFDPQISTYKMLFKNKKLQQIIIECLIDVLNILILYALAPGYVWLIQLIILF